LFQYTPFIAQAK